MSFVVLVLFTMVIACSGCGDRAPSAPSASDSFLAGTWKGTLTIQVNPDIPGAPPASSGATTWTFETVPQTNLQTFKATLQSTQTWLPITTIGTTAVIPSNTPPAQISTQGDYSSPRGCRGTFASFGMATARQIDADFTGVDCDHVTFTGRVSLTKS
jgi:hypothetical protein